METRFTPQGGGEAARGHARAIPGGGFPDPLILKNNQAPIKKGKYRYRYRYTYRHKGKGKWSRTPTHTLAQSAVADNM